MTKGCNYNLRKRKPKLTENVESSASSTPPTKKKQKNSKPKKSSQTSQKKTKKISQTSQKKTKKRTVARKYKKPKTKEDLFTPLVEDVQDEIISFIDVPDLISLGQTNKHFYDFTKRNKCWEKLLVDLFKVRFEKDPGVTRYPICTTPLPLALSERPVRPSEFLPWFLDWLKYYEVQSQIQRTDFNNDEEAQDALNEAYSCMDMEHPFIYSLLDSDTFRQFACYSNVEEIPEEMKSKPNNKWLFVTSGGTLPITLKEYYEKVAKLYAKCHRDKNEQEVDGMNQRNRCFHCHQKFWHCRCRKSTKGFWTRISKIPAPGFEGLPKIPLFSDTMDKLMQENHAYTSDKF